MANFRPAKLVLPTLGPLLSFIIFVVYSEVAQYDNLLPADQYGLDAGHEQTGRTRD